MKVKTKIPDIKKIKFLVKSNKSITNKVYIYNFSIYYYSVTWNPTEHADSMEGECLFYKL